MTRYFLLLVGALLIGAQAQAQTMYRCGSVYQDRPCDAGKKGKAVGSTGTGAAAPQAGVDAECVQRGRDSNKIIWAREGGATQDRLLSEAKTGRERQLIQDVYRRPGAASTVQAAVEADCVAQKEQAAHEAALAYAAAIKAQREGRLDTPPPPSAGIVGTQPPQPDPNADARRKQQLAEQEADNKKRTCARYSEDMDRLRSQERAGGSAATMDSLNERRRSLRERMSKAGC